MTGKLTSELAVHVSTRLNAIPRAIKRLDHSASRLLEAAKRYGNQHVFTEKAEGATLEVDADGKYEAILDVDSLLFEMNSCADLMNKFFGQVRAHVGKPIDDKHPGAESKKVLEAAGLDSGWFKELDRTRNFVAHEGSAYFAVDVGGKSPDLLVLKANVRSFEDANTYLRFAQLSQMVEGFYKAREILQKHLVNLYQKA